MIPASESRLLLERKSVPTIFRNDLSEINPDEHELRMHINAMTAKHVFFMADNDMNQSATLITMTLSVEDVTLTASSIRTPSTAMT